MRNERKLKLSAHRPSGGALSRHVCVCAMLPCCSFQGSGGAVYAEDYFKSQIDAEDVYHLTLTNCSLSNNTAEVRPWPVLCPLAKSHATLKGAAAEHCCPKVTQLCLTQHPCKRIMRCSVCDAMYVTQHNVRG